MQFRFRIKKKDADPTFTEWQDEIIQIGQGATTVVAIHKLRTAHPDAAISIERRTQPEAENTQQ